VQLVGTNTRLVVAWKGPRSALPRGDRPHEAVWDDAQPAVVGGGAQGPGAAMASSGPAAAAAVVAFEASQQEQQLLQPQQQQPQQQQARQAWQPRPTLRVVELDGWLRRGGDGKAGFKDISDCHKRCLWRCGPIAASAIAGVAAGGGGGSSNAAQVDQLDLLADQTARAVKLCAENTQSGGHLSAALNKLRTAHGLEPWRREPDSEQDWKAAAPRAKTAKAPPPPKPKAPKPFTVGNVVHAADSGEYYTAVVLQVEMREGEGSNRLLHPWYEVHYHGFNKRFDRWLDGSHVRRKRGGGTAATAGSGRKRLRK
jgi:hypothetical protein